MDEIGEVWVKGTAETKLYNIRYKFQFIVYDFTYMVNTHHNL
jgi:hypothetical protein